MYVHRFYSSLNALEENEIEYALRYTSRAAKPGFFLLILKGDPVVVAIDSVLQHLQAISSHIVYPSWERRITTHHQQLNLEVRGVEFQRLPLQQLQACSRCVGVADRREHESIAIVMELLHDLVPHKHGLLYVVHRLQSHFERDHRTVMQGGDHPRPNEVQTIQKG